MFKRMMKMWRICILNLSKTRRLPLLIKIRNQLIWCPSSISRLLGSQYSPSQILKLHMVTLHREVTSLTLQILPTMRVMATISAILNEQHRTLTWQKKKLSFQKKRIEQTAKRWLKWGRIHVIQMWRRKQIKLLKWSHTRKWT